MYQSKRIMALLLAVLLVGNLLLTGIPVKAAYTEPVELVLGSTVVWSEDFENFYDDIDAGTATLTENKYSGTKGQIADEYWNGAKFGSWNVYCSIADKGILVQPTKTGGYDGSVGVKLTLDQGGRAMIRYRHVLNSDVYGSLIHGQTYTVKYRIKLEDYTGTSDFNNTLKITNNSNIFEGTVKNDSNRNTILTNGQWVEVEQKFVFSADINSAGDAAKNYVQLEIGNASGSTSTDGATLYLDDVSIEGPVAATAITLPENATVDTADGTLDMNPADGAVISPANATAQWTSSNEAVATVDSNGRVTALRAGTTTITATSVKTTYDTDTKTVIYTTVADTCELTVTGESVSSNILFYEDFNNIYDLIDAGEATLGTTVLDSTGTKSGDSATPYWNGANSGEWILYGHNAGAIIQPSKDGGIDGSGCVMITQNGGRAAIGYNFPVDSEIYTNMIAGVEYKVTAWVKTVDAQKQINLEFVNGEGSTYTRMESANAGWQKIEHTAILIKGGSRDYVRIFLGQAAAGNGTYYYDNITMERVYEAVGVDLGAEESYLQTGNILELNPVAIPSDVITEWVYSSSDSSVAEVDNSGKVTAKKAGTAVITAVAVNGNVQNTITIHVVDELVELESISLNKATLEVNPGHQEKLTVTYNPENATQRKVFWTSTDASVVTVDESGNITAQQVGSATITATVGTKSTVCVVTVEESEGFDSTQIELSVDFGHSTTIDLNNILEGSYTIISNPSKGMVQLTDSRVKYTSYTWLMEKDGKGFTDAEYLDTVKISVKSADGKTAIITLKITINKLEELFYDESNNWITDVDLMFSEEALDAIKTEFQTYPNGLRAELVQKLLKQAESYLNEVPNAYPGDQEDSAETSTGDITVHFLMAYLLTKDVTGYEADNAVYLQKTIEWVKASLAYPYWGTTVQSHRNSDRAAGHQLFSTAMVYHWLKEELEDVTCTDVMGDENADGSLGTITTTENMPILEALEKRLWYVSSQMYNHSLGYEVYVMNHLHIRFSGLLSATIALRADAETAEEKANLIKWTGLSLFKNGQGMNAFMPDGTNHEGLDYWAYGAEWLTKTPIIAESVYGIDFFSMTNLYKDSEEFVLYMMLSQDNWDSNTTIINIGDAQPTLTHGVSQVLRIIAAQYNEPTAQWLAQQFEDAGTEPKNTAIWMSVMFADSSLEAVSPMSGNPTTLKWFEDLDLVVSRSDWSGNEDILAMKTGIPTGKNLMDMVLSGEYIGNPDAGHSHPDANHITLYANGEYLLRDEGYACPKQTSNHNTLLINGKGQLGEGGSWMQEAEYIDANARPHMKVVEANTTYGYDYIVGDATQAYSETLGLSKFERNIVYLKGEQVLLVVDNIQTMQDVPLELRWFPASKTAARVGNTYQIIGDKNIMSFYPFTGEATTAFEDISVTNRYTKVLERGFVQKLYGSNWQNAVAFSWNDLGNEAGKVRYLKGEGDIHQFEVNGKIYAINVATNTVTVSTGELEIPDDGSAGDSKVSTVQINGVIYDEFNADTTTYTMDRWWKTADVDIKAFPNAEGGKVTVSFDNTYPGTITITGESKDGTSQTVYTINVTNSKKILGISNVKSSVVSQGYNLEYVYDGMISVTFREPDKFWVGQNLPAITFDMGKVVTVEAVEIAFHLSDRRDTYFDLLVSEDGTNWTKLVDDGVVLQTPGTSTPSHSEYATVLENANALARYVKVQHRAHSASGKDSVAAFNGIQEITIMGSEEVKQPVEQEITITGGAIDAKIATVTASTEGWKVGENTFTVAADVACVVAVSNDGGVTYTRLEATAVEGGYSFTANLTADSQIAVVVVGDANGDGKITNADAGLVKAVALELESADALMLLTMDVNNSGTITNADAGLLTAVALGLEALTW